MQLHLLVPQQPQVIPLGPQQPQKTNFLASVEALLYLINSEDAQVLWPDTPPKIRGKSGRGRGTDVSRYKNISKRLIL